MASAGTRLAGPAMSAMKVPHCGEGSLPADSIIEFSAPSLSSVKLWDFQLSFLRCGFYKFAILCQHLLCLIEREND
jgi:hypothetical protein